jgi:hypothetical protein
MKVLGTIKIFFPINAFTTPIFIGKDKRYYIQNIVNDKIVGFENFNIEESEILKTEKLKSVKIKDDAIYCYVTESEKLIIGSLSSISDEMFGLLENDQLNPVAKIIISSTYKFHGKTSKLVSESNEYFIESGINCQLNKRDYIDTIPWEEKDRKDLIKKLYRCKYIVDKYKSLDWLDIVEFENKKINIRKFSISIDNYNSISENKINVISNDIVNSILSGLERKTIKKNKIEKNEFIFKLFLNSKTSNSKFDEILFPKSKSNNYMISDYTVENILGRKSDKVVGNKGLFQDSELEKLIEMSKKIKTNIIKNYYDEK